MGFSICPWIQLYSGACHNKTHKFSSARNHESIAVSRPFLVQHSDGSPSRPCALVSISIICNHRQRHIVIICLCPQQLSVHIYMIGLDIVTKSVFAKSCLFVYWSALSDLYGLQPYGGLWLNLQWLISGVSPWSASSLSPLILKNPAKKQRFDTFSFFWSLYCKNWSID